VFTGNFRALALRLTCACDNHRRSGESPSKINTSLGNDKANKLGTIRMSCLLTGKTQRLGLYSDSISPIYCILIMGSTLFIIFQFYISPNKLGTNLIGHDSQSENVYASN